MVEVQTEILSSSPQVTAHSPNSVTETKQNEKTTERVLKGKANSVKRKLFGNGMVKQVPSTNSTNLRNRPEKLYSDSEDEANTPSEVSPHTTPQKNSSKKRKIGNY